MSELKEVHIPDIFYAKIDPSDPIYHRWSFYTDGSYNKSKNISGWGLYIENDAGHCWCLSGSVENPHSRQIDGELVAAVKSFQFIKSCYIPFPDCTIYTDLNLIAKYADGDWIPRMDRRHSALPKYLNTKYNRGNPNAICIQRCIPYIQKFSNLGGNVHWVKGHTGVVGNEIADRLAKKGCGVEY